MVLVKTAVYHAMGTLMPYPSEDPPRLLEVSRPDRRRFMPSAFSSLVSVPVGREASIASPQENVKIDILIKEPGKNHLNWCFTL
jgi:hypothetical protein